MVLDISLDYISFQMFFVISMLWFVFQIFVVAKCNSFMTAVSVFGKESHYYMISIMIMKLIHVILTKTLCFYKFIP